MKTHLLLVISMLVMSFCHAQDTTTHYGKMDYILEHVNHTQITTGLLRDYGIDFANPDVFNGQQLTDTNWVTLTDWRCLYATMYSEQVDTPKTMLYLDTINNLI